MSGPTFEVGPNVAIAEALPLTRKGVVAQPFRQLGIRCEHLDHVEKVAVQIGVCPLLALVVALEPRGSLDRPHHSVSDLPSDGGAGGGGAGVPGAGATGIGMAVLGEIGVQGTVMSDAPTSSAVSMSAL